MPNQSTAANVYPLTRFVPVSQLPAESDPIPAMRREMKLLRIELERLRAMQKFSLAHIDCIMNDRDQWQREAERLSDLMAEAPLSTHEDGVPTVSPANDDPDVPKPRSSPLAWCGLALCIGGVILTAIANYWP